jgi:hypothetical protein
LLAIVLPLAVAALLKASLHRHAPAADPARHPGA